MATHSSFTLGRFLVLCVLAVQTALAAAPAAALLSVVETLRDVPIERPEDVVVSADDRFVYVLGDSALAVLRRDAATGFVSFVEAYLDGYDGVEGIFGAGSMALSPDDRFLYVGSPRLFRGGVASSAVAIFERDAAAGTLSLVDVHTAGFAGTGALELTLSSDGAHFYVTGAGGAVRVFARDAADGGLSFAGATSEGIDGETYALSAALDPADRYLYVAQATNAVTDATDGLLFRAGRLTVYARDPATGALTFVEDHVNQAGDVEDMDVPSGVTVSPDGAHVYVMNASNFPYDGDGGALVGFRREAATGRLTFIGRQDYVLSPSDGAWSDDGTRLYLAGAGGATDGLLSQFVAYARDAADGTLERIVRISEDDEFFGFPSPLLAIALSGDGRFLYAGAFSGKLLAVWEIEGDGAPRPISDPDDPSGGRGTARGAGRAAVSPDGRHLYLTSAAGRSLAIFERDPRTGKLAVLALAGTEDLFFSEVGPVAVSADGRFVYALQNVFVRDAESGLLAGVLQQDFRVDLSGVDAVPSPDGRHLYVLLDTLDGPIAAYAQAADGSLEPVTIRIPPVAGHGRLVGARMAAASADGLYLYVLGSFSDSDGDVVWAFARNPVSGRLTLEAFVELSSRIPERRFAVASPRHVYVVQANGLLVFRHDRAAKRLRLVEEHADGVAGVSGLDEPVDVTLSPSGDLVFVAGRRSEAVAVFARDAESGLLSFLEAARGGPEAGDELVRPQALAAAPDGRHLYVVSPRLAALTTMALDPALGCAAADGALCLGGGRFRVEVEWRDGRGQTGRAHVVPLAPAGDSGVLWFFSPDNWEMLVKVLDGCKVNGRIWVFAAATTDVAYTLRVTDVESGTVKEYVNPLGRAAPAITDTEAFAECPE